VIEFRALRFVPIAFVDADHFAGVAGDAAVGEEVGRVGEDEVDGGCGEGGEEFEGVSMVEAEMMLGIVEGQGFGEERVGGGERGGHDDQMGSLIRW